MISSKFWWDSVGFCGSHRNVWPSLSHTILTLPNITAKRLNPSVGLLNLSIHHHPRPGCDTVPGKHSGYWLIRWSRSTSITSTNVTTCHHTKKPNCDGLKNQISSSVWWIPHDSLLQHGIFSVPIVITSQGILHGTSVWRPRHLEHQGPARTSVVDASAEDHVDFLNLAWLSSSEKFHGKMPTSSGLP